MMRAKWSATEDWRGLLYFFVDNKDLRDRYDRKLRLIACAACRKVWRQLRDPQVRRAVEASERYADSFRTVQEQLDELRKLLTGPPIKDVDVVISEFSARLRTDEELKEIHDHFQDQSSSISTLGARITIGDGISTALETGGELTEVLQWLTPEQYSGIIRDIIGNPVSRTKADPEKLSSSVIEMARTIYAERDFSLMAALAERLEGTGCKSQEILSHCRDLKEHFRGCWVVDLLLGKL